MLLEKMRRHFRQINQRSRRRLRAKQLLIERLQVMEAEAQRYVEKQAMGLRLSRK